MTSNLKESVIEKYFGMSEELSKKHGSEILVLLQIGSFYEFYSLEKDKTRMAEICNILSITMTRRDNKKSSDKTFTKNNPGMAGFPTISIAKHIARLIQAGFMVAVYDQAGKNDMTGKHDHVLQGIYSPGTFVSDSETTQQDGTTLVGIWMEQCEQLAGKVLPAMGFCSIDIATGKVLVHECYARADEPNLPYDELIQLAMKVSAREVVICSDKDTFKTTSNCFEVESHLIHHRKETPKDWERCAYQNEVLERIFGKRSPSPIENLGLEKKPFLLKALILTLEWAWEHVNIQIKNLQDPIFVDTNKMVLGNSAIYQLNILENTMLEGNYRKKGIRSLMSVVDQTTTAMGRRYLKNQLTSPLIDHKEINARLNSVETLVLDEPLRKAIGMGLTGVMDLERLHRRMILGTLGPIEFTALHNSYTNLIDMYRNIRKLANVNSKWLDKLARLMRCYSTNLRMNRVTKGWNISDIRQNLFIEGIDKKLDLMDKELSQHVEFMNTVVKKFSKLLDCNLELVDTDRDGYQIKTTKIRGTELNKQLCQNPITIGEIIINKVEIKMNGASCRVVFPEFSKHGEARRSTELRLAKRMRKLWIRVMGRIYTHCESTLVAVVEGTSEIDYLISAAKTAVENNYCRPDIIKPTKDKVSMVECKQMRHPIIEKLVESTYIPHDISLGGEGLLLYGSNGSGKSSLSKSLGLLTVMAQCGMFVPAKSMKLVPYKHLYARITGNDNILRGLSSFAVEMLELKAILKNSGKNSMFVGDELCRGTESASGAAIVATAVEELAKSQATFIFATHLHDLPKLPEISSLKNVKVCHIHSTFDKKSGKIIYERDLRDGQGDTVYGLNVCCSILNDTSFMNRADYFVRKLIGEEKGEIVEKRKSKWNADIYMTDCTICHSKENLNVHHIRHRAKCTDGYSEHVRQDSKGNLVVLCRPCHEETHSNAIEITGWQDTSSGRELIWKRIIQQEIENIIRKIKNDYEKNDWVKDWAHNDAVKKLNKMGHLVTAEQIKRSWNKIIHKSSL